MFVISASSLSSPQVRCWLPQWWQKYPFSSFCIQAFLIPSCKQLILRRRLIADSLPVVEFWLLLLCRLGQSSSHSGVCTRHLGNLSKTYSDVVGWMGVQWVHWWCWYEDQTLSHEGSPHVPRSAGISSYFYYLSNKTVAQSPSLFSTERTLYHCFCNSFTQVIQVHPVNIEHLVFKVPYHILKTDKQSAVLRVLDVSSHVACDTPEVSSEPTRNQGSSISQSWKTPQEAPLPFGSWRMKRIH